MCSPFPSRKRKKEVKVHILSSFLPFFLAIHSITFSLHLLFFLFFTFFLSLSFCYFLPSQSSLSFHYLLSPFFCFVLSFSFSISLWIFFFHFPSITLFYSHISFFLSFPFSSPLSLIFCFCVYYSLWTSFDSNYHKIFFTGMSCDKIVFIVWFVLQSYAITMDS